MATHKLQAELKRLLAERRMLQNEVFGGFSNEERLEYQQNSDQLHELLSDNQASEVGKSSSGSAQAEPESVKKVKEKRKARGSVA